MSAEGSSAGVVGEYLYVLCLLVFVLPIRIGVESWDDGISVDNKSWLCSGIWTDSAIYRAKADGAVGLGSISVFLRLGTVWRTLVRHLYYYGGNLVFLWLCCQETLGG
jgi:hypothetical protein